MEKKTPHQALHPEMNWLYTLFFCPASSAGFSLHHETSWFRVMPYFFPCDHVTGRTNCRNCTTKRQWIGICSVCSSLALWLCRRMCMLTQTVMQTNLQRWYTSPCLHEVAFLHQLEIRSRRRVVWAEHVDVAILAFIHIFMQKLA
jgi:hypothetical protein